MRWIDLSAYKMTLFLIEITRPGEMVPRRQLTLLAPGPDVPAAGLKKLGFRQNAATPKLWINERLEHPDIDAMLRTLPEARLSEAMFSDVLRQVRVQGPGPAPAGDGGVPDEPSITAPSRPKLTRLFNTVFEDEAGLRWLLQSGTPVPEKPDSSRVTFLRPETKQDLVDVARLYRFHTISRGEAVRGGDLERFCKIIGCDTPERMRAFLICLQDLDVHSLESGNIRKSWTVAVENARLMLPGAGLAAEFKGALPVALPIKIATQRALMLAPLPRGERFGTSKDSDLGSVFLLPGARSEIPDLDGPVTVVPNHALLDLSDELVLPQPVEIDGYMCSRIGEARLLRFLAAREAAGQTVVMWRQNDALDPALWRWIACRYGIEGRATVPSNMAFSGQAEGDGLTLISIGRRREHVSAEPHDASMRVRMVEDWPALWSWSAQVIDNRVKIDRYLAAAGLDGGLSLNASEGVRNHFQVPYASLSQIGQASAMLPRNLEGAVRHAFKRIQRKHPVPDQWLAEQLQIPQDRLGDVLTPEQADGIMLALDAIERRGAMIIADQTGLGKGREGSAIMLAALRSGRFKRVIFMTKEAIGIGDICRDIRHINGFSTFTPFTLNAGVDIRDEVTSETWLDLPGAAMVKDIVTRRAWPDDHNLCLMTYSQVNRPAKAKKGMALEAGAPNVGIGAKTRWLDAVVDKETFLLLDEAHASAGDSNIGEAINRAVDKCGAVCYMSGTHSKSPKMTRSYRRVLPPSITLDTLIQSLSRGGETMQEAFSTMLAREGVLIRREHDFSKCDFVTLAPAEDRIEIYKAHSDALAAVLSEIGFLNGDLDGRINHYNRRVMDDLIRRNPGLAEERDELRVRMRSLEMRRQNFGSPLHNITRLFVTALMAEEAADIAIDRLRNGRKPVILVENTVEALIRETLDEVGVEPGGRMPHFADLLRRVVRQMLYYQPAREHHPRGRGHGLQPRAPRQRMLDQPEMAPQRKGYLANLFKVAAEKSPEVEAARAAGDIAALQQALDVAMAKAGQVFVSRGYCSEQLVEDILSEFQGLARAGQDRLHAAKDGITGEGGRDALIGVLNEIIPDQPTGLAAILCRIDATIDNVPDLPISVLDVVRERIEAADPGEGKPRYSFDEITGRKFQVKDSRVVPRETTDRVTIRNKFNNGGLSAVGINASGATGLDLHASPRFEDQSPRTLIALQLPQDPVVMLQGFGRIVRLGQTDRPEIVIPMTGMPIHVRLMAMVNAKLRRVAANITANRESSAAVEDVLDLMNRVGDTVCSRYMAERPDVARKLHFKADQFVKEPGDNDGKEPAEPCAGNALGDDGEDDKRSANTILSRFIMLPYAEQEQYLEDLTSEYVAEIQELDAKGENPLRSAVIEGRVHLGNIMPLSGQEEATEAEGLDSLKAKTVDQDDISEFQQPVYIQTVTIERLVEPIRSKAVQHEVERGLGLYALHRIEAIPDELIRTRERILDLWRNNRAVSLDEEIDMLRAATPEDAAQPILVRKSDEMIRLIATLVSLKPGAEISMTMDAVVTPGIIVTRVLAPVFSISTASQYSVVFIAPGDAMHKEISLTTLLRDPNFTVKDGLGGEQRDEVLTRFDADIMASRQETRQILTGNLLEAMQINIKRKLGHMVSWTDDAGIVHRGVLVSRGKADKLDFLPTPVTSDAIAEACLFDYRTTMYSDAMLSPAQMMIGVYKGANLKGMPPEQMTARIFMPSGMTPAGSRAWAVPGIMDMITRHGIVPDGIDPKDKARLDQSRAILLEAQAQDGIPQADAMFCLPRPAAMQVIGLARRDGYAFYAKAGLRKQLNKVNAEDHDAEKNENPRVRRGAPQVPAAPRVAMVIPRAPARLPPAAEPVQAAGQRPVPPPVLRPVQQVGG